MINMGYMYYLMRNEEMIIGILSLLSIVYFLPLIQALIAYEKTKWLERQFASTVSSGDGETVIREKLLEASKPGQSYPIYKLIKFYFASMGIVALVMGLLIMILPQEVINDRDAIDWMLFFP